MLDNPRIRTPLAISLGAIAGALCRYFVGHWVTAFISPEFPLGTMVVNLSGCFLMGWVTTLAGGRRSIQPDLLLMATTGFLGSYTTFSSYELDAVTLFTSESLKGDLLYWMGSPLLGFLCLLAGATVAAIANPPSSDDQD
ncbi:MAG: fluoride efflux transporter CrcB [Synechococcales cyanobacterium T60_A2020_003]|nr:fluoride efflux transporter CrcB [Synechococcales cyanobacterium T60_A2020_003]